MDIFRLRVWGEQKFNFQQKRKKKLEVSESDEGRAETFKVRKSFVTMTNELE